jgi:hypothetical protein
MADISLRGRQIAYQMVLVRCQVLGNEILLSGFVLFYGGLSSFCSFNFVESLTTFLIDL